MVGGRLRDSGGGGVMETRSVSRCVAIAAHGKRCQQSPFRGSPYCWHHTQSRKIWAPSRPLGSAATNRASDATERVEAEERRLGIERRSAADRRAGRAAREAAAHRLSEALGPERVEELLDFLESRSEGAYLLVRDSGGLGVEEGRAVDARQGGQDAGVVHPPRAQRALQLPARGSQPEALRRRRSGRSATLRSEARPPESRTSR